MIMMIICNYYDDDVGGGYEYDHDRENYGDGPQILLNCTLRTSWVCKQSRGKLS